MNVAPALFRYSILQYYDDPVRGEPLNVGVIVERESDGALYHAFGDGRWPRQIYPGFDEKLFRSLVSRACRQLW
jgi:hypothetical protein